MIDITNLHIHYRPLQRNGQPYPEKKTGIMKLIVIQPTDPTSSFEIKRDIAKVLAKIKPRAEYYYVVVEIDRDGTPAYRPIIPKIFLHR